MNIIGLINQTLEKVTRDIQMHDLIYKFNVFEDKVYIIPSSVDTSRLIERF